MAVRPIDHLDSIRARRALVAASARPAAAFGVALIGLLIVGDRYHDDSLCWPVWLATGFLAGAIAGSVRHIWTVGAAAIAFPVLAIWQGVPHLAVDPFYWTMLMVVGATIVAAGFAMGARAVARSTHGGALDRWITIAAVSLGLVGFAAWGALSGIIGSDTMLYLTSEKEARACFTPASRYGWRYEAINYDISNDATLLAGQPDHAACRDQGTKAGMAVVARDPVTPDVVPIAGWYIPAQAAIGPTGPTIVIVPGWKANKSDVLEYAPAFHGSFNLVIVDLRNGGRSGGTVTTWGDRERDDVEAMVDWLVETKHPSWIGAMGNSMGAATALVEAVDDPRIGALILDSMHGSVVAAVANGAESESFVPGYPSAWAAVAIASLRVGTDLTAIDPERTISRIGDRPVLLIHGTDDAVDVPERSSERVFAAGVAAGVPIELRYCEGGTHGRLVRECGASWTRWALDFLDRVVRSRPDTAG